MTKAIRYRAYYSTDPRCVGYAEDETESKRAWACVMAHKPSITGTASQVVRWRSRLRREIGPGSVIEVRIFRVGDGAECTWDEIYNLA